MKQRGTLRNWVLVLVVCSGCIPGWADGLAVTAKIEVVGEVIGGKVAKAESSASSLEAKATAMNASNVALWLIPVDANGKPQTTHIAPLTPIPQIVQRNKTFEPHVVVVQVGSAIEFPNKDPFFHNVFSLYDGKRFDLGLYEAGTTRSVHFNRVGVSFLFCNIHSEMSAVVVAVDTPYFALSDSAGHLAIPNVPDGRYEMHVWYERSQPDGLKAFDRMVTISPSTRALGTVQVTDSHDFKLAHKNKYGQDYIPPAAAAY
jgi:plastocyanin